MTGKPPVHRQSPIRKTLSANKNACSLNGNQLQLEVIVAQSFQGGRELVSRMLSINFRIKTISLLFAADYMKCRIQPQYLVVV
jgi:hypothetical protein